MLNWPAPRSRDQQIEGQIAKALAEVKPEDLANMLILQLGVNPDADKSRECAESIMRMARLGMLHYVANKMHESMPTLPRSAPVN
jgi:hypothetical protein